MSVTLVCSLLGMAYMFGVQRQEINDLSERLGRQEAYSQDVVSLKEQVKQIGMTLQEVRTDIKQLVINK